MSRKRIQLKETGISVLAFTIDCLGIVEKVLNEYFDVLRRFQTTTKIRELETAGEIVRNEIVVSSMAIQRKRRLVVMAMTADVFSTNSEKIAAGKMDGFITKPIDEYQLYRALKAI